MNLPTSLLSEFAKVTNDEAEKPKEYTAYGKVISVNTQTGTYNVLLDGAENPIVCNATTAAKQNDRVAVSIKNRQATVTGNASSKTINGDVLVNGDATFKGRVEAESGYFKGELQAATGSFKGNLDAVGGTFKGNLSAAGGTFSGDVNISPKGSRRCSVRIVPDINGIIMNERIGSTPYSNLLNSSGLSIDREEGNNMYTVSVSETYVAVSQLVSGTYRSAIHDISGYHTSSDIRLKENIAKLKPEAAKQLNPVSFRFKGDKKIHYGFIAQEVQKVLPDTVSKSPDGYLTLNYQELIAPLCALVHELQSEVEKLKDEVEELKKKG